MPDPDFREFREQTTDGRKALEQEEFDKSVHGLIKRKKRIGVETIADQLDCAPGKVRAALERLRIAGYRVPEEKGEIILEPVNPDQNNVHREAIPASLLDGDVLRIGQISDTHLSSKEEALDELHLAYDVFEREGITTVLHSGDFTAGVGIYRTQAQDLKHHTFDDQVDYLEREYPRRPGITTKGIAGNHDIEGDFGKLGANPVLALANRRDDIEYLGDFDAWLELPNGAWWHLLHGRGGMSYAYSYKAQKLVDGYPSGRKPAVLAPGHWHVSAVLEARGVQVLFPACFEWKTNLLKRIGLTPSVGFWIIEATLGDDGSLVKFAPTFHRFWEGRQVTAAV
jgi:predicted phosphodiesterase